MAIDSFSFHPCLSVFMLFESFIEIKNLILSVSVNQTVIETKLVETISELR